MTPVIEGDFVVFLIGMRLNRPWKVWKWWPVFTAMPKMLRELEQHPELGLLGYRQLLGNPLAPAVLQYWRSFDHLDAFARAKDHTHFPAWTMFNKTVASNGDVGIWHETYLVRAGNYEAVYNTMPPFGLGKAGELVPAAGRRSSAPGRIGRGEPDDDAINPPG
ncbi:MAG: DUF4188 domain-containing protein [Hyphomicrobiales bacterium]